MDSPLIKARQHIVLPTAVRNFTRGWHVITYADDDALEAFPSRFIVVPHSLV
jgi:hypothetical protein